MDVDWVTVAAQILNFLVLVWLLQRFLYGPITRAMKRREERIRGRIEEAEEARAEAERRAEALDEERRDLDERRQEMLSEAREQAEDLRSRLEAEIHAEIEEKRRAWRAELAEDRAEFLATLRAESIEGFRRFASDALRALADEDLERRVSAAFLSRLEGLGEDRLGRLREAAAEAGRLRVESGRPLEAETKRRLTRTIHERLGEGIEVDYAEDEDHLIGLRLRAGGETLAWTLGEYLQRFTERLEGAFPEPEPEETPEPAPEAAREPEPGAAPEPEEAGRG